MEINHHSYHFFSVSNVPSSLATFTIYPLSLIFSSFTMMCFCFYVCLFGWFPSSLSESCELSGFVCCHFFKNWLIPFLFSVLSFSETPSACILECVILSHRSLRLCSFLSIFFSLSFSSKDFYWCLHVHWHFPLLHPICC